MNADQLLANGFDQQGSNNAGVNAAAERQQNLLVANLSANFCNLLINEFLCQFHGSDTLHGFGTYIARHRNTLQIKNEYGFLTFTGNIINLFFLQCNSFFCMQKNFVDVTTMSGMKKAFLLQFGGGVV
jgi:hypothetical protein